jgi:hypothetical protein
MSKQVVASQLAIAVLVTEMILGTSSAVLVMWKKFPQAGT